MLPQAPYLDILAPDDVRVRGTRVGIEHLLSAYRDGSLAEEIAVQFPTVSLAQVHGVIAYYLNHRAEVDEYLAQWRDHASQARREQAARAAPEVVQRQQSPSVPSVSSKEVSDLRGKLAAWEDDWNAPGMEAYDTPESWAEASVAMTGEFFDQEIWPDEESHNEPK